MLCGSTLPRLISPLSTVEGSLHFVDVLGSSTSSGFAEYLVWSSNNGKLDGDDVLVDGEPDAVGDIVSYVVAEDGVVYDDAGWVSVVGGERAGTNPYQVRVSISEGVSVISTVLRRSRSQFYWTRNDVYETNFGSDLVLSRGRNRRFVGTVGYDTLKVSLPRWWREGDLARVFISGVATFVRVTSDGVLQPDLESLFGLDVWEHFEESVLGSDGVLGSVDSELYLCPINFDLPLLRIGNRSYLEVIRVDLDSDLTSLVVQSGQVGVSEYSGRLKFADGESGVVYSDGYAKAVHSTWSADINGDAFTQTMGIADTYDLSGAEYWHSSGGGLRGSGGRIRGFPVAGSFTSSAGPVKVVRTASGSFEGTVLLGLDGTVVDGGGSVSYYSGAYTPWHTFGDFIYSKKHHLFTFVGGEVFYANGLTWTAPLGTYTVSEVVASLSAVIPCREKFGHIVFDAPIRINFGDSKVDVSGAHALGFNPGWSDHSNGFDTGLTISVEDSVAYRQAYGAINAPNSLPYGFLTFNPLEDRIGFDVNTYFATVKGDTYTNLVPGQDVQYQFGSSKFAWLSPLSKSGDVLEPVSSIGLGSSPVDVTVKVSEDGGVLTDAPYFLDSTTGELSFTNEIGKLKLSGYKGSCIGVQFTGEGFEGVSVGDFLKCGGVYRRVVSVDGSTTLTLSGSVDGTFWEVFEGVSSGYDPRQITDALWVPFDHVVSDPWTIKRLGSFDSRSSFARVGGQDIPLNRLQRQEITDTLPQGWRVPFVIECGPTVVTPVLVSTFTQAPDVVEYRSDGSISVGSDFSGCVVRYVPQPLDTYDVSVDGECTAQADDFVEVVTDATVNPLSGTVSLARPLNVGDGIEISYYQATAEGRKVDTLVTETIQFKGFEVATRVSPTTYSFSGGSSVEVSTSGGYRFYSSEYRIEGSQIVFKKGIPDVAPIRVNYRKDRAFGGESKFSVAKTPMYRPPFFIEAGKTYFGLRGDRLGDLGVGRVFRVNDDCLTITALTYFSSEDVTRVDFSPSFSRELGSRGPSVSLMVSDRVTDYFIRYRSVSIPSNTQHVELIGDWSLYAQPGHILAVDTSYYVIKSVSVSDNITTIDVTIDKPVSGSLKLSYVPWYEIGSFEMPALGLLIGQPTIIHNGVDSGSRFELGSGDSVYAHYTQRKVLSPKWVNGSLQIPRYEVSGHSICPKPSTDEVWGKFQYRDPSKYYAASLPITRVVADAVENLKSEMGADTNPATLPTSKATWARYSSLLDIVRNRDSSARYMLDIYSRLIQGFEGVLTVAGGDIYPELPLESPIRDIPTRGYVDALTGELNARNLWINVNAEAHSLGFLPGTDDVVDPASAVLVGDDIVGPVPQTVDREAQNVYVHNAIDDVALVAFGQTENATISTDPYVEVRAKGVFRAIGSDTFYPSQSEYFVTTTPGPYTSGRWVDGVYVSTTGNSIAQTQNINLGVLGEARSVRDRVPRAFVQGYYPNGLGSVSEPCLLVHMGTPIPIVPNTGLPDTSQLLSQGGSLPDASTGDAFYSRPPFLPGEDLRFDDFLGVTDLSVSSGQLIYAPLKVFDVVDGCLIRFGSGTVISDPNSVFALSDGQPVLLSSQNFSEVLGLGSTYRIGFDVGVNGSDLVDMTLPSPADGGEDVQGLMGQTPPQPLSSLEGQALVSYTSVLPKATGSYSGDFPGVADNELQVLRELSPQMGVFAQIPDEVADTFTYAPNYFSSSKDLSSVRPFDLALVKIGGYASLDGIQTVGGVDTGKIRLPRFVTPTTAPLGSRLTGSSIRYEFNNAMVFLHDTLGVRFRVLDTDGDSIPDTTYLDFTDTGIELNDGVSDGVGNLNEIWSADPMDPRYYNKITLTFLSRTDPAITVTPGGNPLPTEGNILYTITFEKGTISAVDYANVTTNTVSVPVSFGVNLPGGIGIPTQIQIDSANLIDFSGFPTSWFLPYLVSGVDKISKHSYEVLVSVDTYNWDGIALTKGASRTGFIGSDRCSFADVFDMRFTTRSGALHPDSGISIQSELLVHEVRTPAGSSTVNRDVNGSSTPLTFEPEAGAIWPYAGGTWVPADTLAGTYELGKIYVPSVGGDVEAVLMPSTTVCVGTGVCESRLNTSVPNPSSYDYRVTSVSFSSGGYSDIQAGDVLAIYKSADIIHEATNKAGSYVVHNTVSVAGHTFSNPIGEGWVDKIWPTVTGYTGTTITLSNVTGFPPTGQVYVVFDSSLLQSSTVGEYKQALLSWDYSGIVGHTMTLSSAPVWADGSLVTTVPEVLGCVASGFTKLYVDVGLVCDESGTVSGFSNLDVGSLSLGTGDFIVGVPGLGQVGIIQHVPTSPNIYDSDPQAILYPGIPEYLEFNLSAAQWDVINNPNGFVGAEVACFVPGVVLTASYLAQTGIFLEPSTPKSVPEIGHTEPYLVQLGNSLSATEIGFRNAKDYVGIGETPSILPESITFEVRRVRRWHDQPNLMGWRKLLEVRRGLITSYSGTQLIASGFTWDDGKVYSGTTLGGFDTTEVSPGHWIRLLDNGEVVETSYVQKVVSGSEIYVSPPLANAAPGMKFEIWVPTQEAHLESLRDVLVTKTILSESSIVTTPNELPVSSSAKVQVGDIVIVDPSIFGAAPKGDRSISTRSYYQAGVPESNDDNRGFYRVTGISDDVLTVDGGNTYTGIFESSYVYLPTVSGEGQNDLRAAGLQPISFKVVRPSNLLSDKAVDTILFQRERVLSLIQLLSDIKDREGSYHDFMRLQQCSDPNVYGVIPDSILLPLLGEFGETPYANSNTCLSVLDRRFQLGDSWLLLQQPLNTYEAQAQTGDPYGVPQVSWLKRIEQVISVEDHLREIWYAWLSYRVHKTKGTMMLYEMLKQQAETKALESIYSSYVVDTTEVNYG